MAWLTITRKIRVETGRELSENELDVALAVPQDNRLWMALHQLIKTAMDNATDNAAVNMDPPTVMAGYVGGHEHLKMLRDDLISRRENGLLLLGGNVFRPEKMEE